jgi:hypothetical protein
MEIASVIVFVGQLGFRLKAQVCESERSWPVILASWTWIDTFVF